MKLDELIELKAYELDSLRLLKSILNSGDCNICSYRNKCNMLPAPGQLVRYNCYNYKSMFRGSEKE